MWVLHSEQICPNLFKFSSQNYTFQQWQDAKKRSRIKQPAVNSKSSDLGSMLPKQLLNRGQFLVGYLSTKGP
ncbi:hypothetical protein BT93_E1177 [Corymbia citriodora subsp. variegata]|nr:hypothetical protein BT93_E1177 [Corymbia citriodora subsp. variegata]